MSEHRLYPLIAPLIAIVLASLAAAPEAMAQQTGRRVGVVVSMHVNLSADEARNVASLLGQTLQEVLPIETISGEEVDRRLPQKGLPSGCVASAECRVDMGRRLDADELMFLVLVRLGEDIQIDTTWTDVVSGKVTSRPAIRITPGADAAEVFRKAAPSLLPHIARRKGEAGVPNLIVVSSPDSERDAGKPIPTGTWIAGSMSAAFLIGGTVFALSAQSKYHTLADSECQIMRCEQGDIDELRRHALVADVMFAAALASGVTAAVLYVRSDEKTPRARPRATPSMTVSVGPGAALLSLGGVF